MTATIIKAIPVAITDKQREILEELLRKRSTPQDHVYRIQIILLASQDVGNRTISKQIKLDRSTVKLWRNRWSTMESTLNIAETKGGENELRKKLDEFLSDSPRSGAPGIFTAEQICQIIAVALKPPADCGVPISHWTSQSLADEVVKQKIVPAISASSIARFLKSSRSKTP
jgi:putative transposase